MVFKEALAVPPWVVGGRWDALEGQCFLFTRMFTKMILVRYFKS